MIDQNKINQVYEAIIENGMEAFQDNDLVKLFSMLNKYELIEAENSAYFKFYDYYKSESLAYHNSKRIESITPLVELMIDDKMKRIKDSNIMEYLNQALMNNSYHEFLSRSDVNDLMNIKYFLSNNVNVHDEVNVRATKKIIAIILKELNNRVGNQINS